mmetsp:Transcript_36247/g.62531  ORF Transcript_36247/g.62531 Transcript_36247/m.62531 type:complete len:221 (+) Transcript_36247:1753-2415(+)
MRVLSLLGPQQLDVIVDAAVVRVHAIHQPGLVDSRNEREDDRVKHQESAGDSKYNHDIFGSEVGGGHLRLREGNLQVPIHSIEHHHREVVFDTDVVDHHEEQQHNPGEHAAVDGAQCETIKTTTQIVRKIHILGKAIQLGKQRLCQTELNVIPGAAERKHLQVEEERTPPAGLEVLKILNHQICLLRVHETILRNSRNRLYHQVECMHDEEESNEEEVHM